MLQHAVGRFVGAVGGVRGYLRFASCLGVLRTLGFYINLHQSAMNDHPCCVLVHASPPQRAEAHLREEMFFNGYALQTRQCKWAHPTNPVE